MENFFAICKYVSSLPSTIFSNIEDAAKAYNLHMLRLERRENNDSLKAFHKAYHNHKYFRTHRGIEYSKWYDFREVRSFLKANHLWGIQCFNSRNISGDYTETIYRKDGICIEYCGGYDYIEVFGLSEKDFAELERAYEAKFDDWKELQV